MNYKEITQQSYQATAQAYATNVQDLAPLESIHKFMTLLPAKPRILDIGCGSGRDAKTFSELGAKVIGIDFCENLLNIAKANATQATFHLMDIETMDFQEASFDGAWAACSLMHIAKENLPSVLQNIHRMLTPSGYLYLAIKQGKGEKLEKDLRYEGNIQKFWSFYEEAELKQALINAQFKNIECDLIQRTHDYQTHPAFRVFCQKK